MVVAGSSLKLLDEWANFANCEDMPVFCQRPQDLVIKRWTFVLLVASQHLLQDVLVQHCWNWVSEIAADLKPKVRLIIICAYCKLPTCCCVACWTLRFILVIHCCRFVVILSDFLFLLFILILLLFHFYAYAVTKCAPLLWLQYNLCTFGMAGRWVGQVGHVTGVHGEFHYESLKIQKDKQKVKILPCEWESEVEALRGTVVRLGNVEGGIDIMNIGKNTLAPTSG